MRPFISVACIAMLLAQPSAQSHTPIAPDGSTVTWYPHECCHDGDCRPVVSIERASNGLWMRTAGGQTVLIGPADERRLSRDMRWHICLFFDSHEQILKVRCLFEPPNT
jgi:hypothetical protein